jgi:hypothetical protein
MLFFSFFFSILWRSEEVSADFDVLTYVRSLEDSFQSKREKYSLFYETLNDFIHDR